MQNEIRDMAQARHMLNLATSHLGEITKYLNDKPEVQRPRVMLSDGGNHYVELSIENVTGPDRDMPWLVLVQFLRALQNGKGRVSIQLGRDQDTRISHVAPLATFSKMIQTMRSK